MKIPGGGPKLPKEPTRPKLNPNSPASVREFIFYLINKERWKKDCKRITKKFIEDKLKEDIQRQRNAGNYNPKFTDKQKEDNKKLGINIDKLKKELPIDKDLVKGSNFTLKGRDYVVAELKSAETKKSYKYPYGRALINMEPNSNQVGFPMDIRKFTNFMTNTEKITEIGKSLIERIIANMKDYLSTFKAGFLIPSDQVNNKQQFQQLIIDAINGKKGISNTARNYISKLNLDVKDAAAIKSAMKPTNEGFRLDSSSPSLTVTHKEYLMGRDRSNRRKKVIDIGKRAGTPYKFAGYTKSNPKNKVNNAHDVNIIEEIEKGFYFYTSGKDLDFMEAKDVFRTILLGSLSNVKDIFWLEFKKALRKEAMVK